jgi:hypothetical protein
MNDIDPVKTTESSPSHSPGNQSTSGIIRDPVRSRATDSRIRDNCKTMKFSTVNPVSIAPLRQDSLGYRHRSQTHATRVQLLAAVLFAVALVLSLTL